MPAAPPLPPLNNPGGSASAAPAAAAVLATAGATATAGVLILELGFR